jgi:hypothetical protein
MAKLEIRCPTCSARGYIDISEEALKNVTKGLLAVNIAVGMVCEHSFVAYVDKNMQIRDYFIADFQIQLPETPSSEAPKGKIIPETESLDVELIRINIPALLIAHVIRASFYGKKIILLSDQDFLYNHISNFFKFISRESFDLDISIISEEVYKANKKIYKNELILEGIKVIRDPDKIISSKKLELEKSIAEKFLSEYDLMTSLIIIRNEIHKIYTYAKSIVDFIQNLGGKAITSKMLIDHVAKTHDEQLKMPQLNFLIDIVKNYFKVEMPPIDGVSDLLGFL